MSDVEIVTMSDYSSSAKMLVILLVTPCLSIKLLCKGLSNDEQYAGSVLSYLASVDV